MTASEKRPSPFVNRKPLTPGGRDNFLARVRSGLQHDASASPIPPSPPPVRDEALIRQAHLGDPGLVERWVSKARGNTMIVNRVPADGALVQAAIDSALAAHAVSKILVNAQSLDERFGVTAHLRQRNMEVLPWGAPDCSAAAFHCQAAITDCRAALADAGSLLVWSDESFGRSSTLVVQVHIILLPASRILADMIDGFDFLFAQTAGKLPSNVVIINGPSKTADIEMNLVTGVHGPKILSVVLIDGM